MVAPIVEYVIARKAGEGWSVLRDGAPIGRRCQLVGALDFATHLAEREATHGGRHTRVVMERNDMHRLSRFHPWRLAA